MSEIRICDRHEKEVPLIMTMAFPGAEFWCPYCGANYGFLGAGELVEETPELEQAAKEWEKKARPYIRAISSRTAAKIKHEGEWLTPDKLPDAVKAKHQKVIQNWQYEGHDEHDTP